MIDDYSDMIALVPMRAQPLHYGHINLLLNVSRSFGRVVVLLSPHYDQCNNPFSYERRYKWLISSQATYGLSFDIVQLPDFPSQMQKKKTSNQISTIRAAFSEIGGDNFVIVTGNKKVIHACDHVYNFANLLIGEDIRTKRLLSHDNPFSHYEDNGQDLRNNIYQRNFVQLRCCVPPFVIHDCHRLFLQKKC